MGQEKLTYDELLTAITEVEMVINSRPLSYVSADDMEEPLTPSHLLIGRRVMSLPDHIYHEITDEDEVNSHLLNKRARHLNYTLNRFWVRWRNEYLLELREAHRHSGGSPNALSIAVGDVVVVVHSDDQPRGFWKLAKVEDSYRSGWPAKRSYSQGCKQGKASSHSETSNTATLPIGG